MNGFWNNKWIKRGACALLCAGMLAAMLFGGAAHSTGPQAPEPGELRSLELLTGGDSAAEAGGAGGEGALEQTDAAPGEGEDREEPPSPETPPDPDETQDPTSVSTDPDRTDTPGQDPDPAPGETADPAHSDAQDPGQTNGSTVGSDEPGSLDAPDSTGSEGGDETELELGALLTWQKYGREESTVVCEPGGRVRRTVLWNQAPAGRFEYAFSLFGDDALYAEIESLQFAEGGARGSEIPLSGRVTLSRREDGVQNASFTLTAVVEKTLADGSVRSERVRFTFVIRYQDGLDLGLELGLLRSGSLSTLGIAADGTARRTVLSSELTEGALHYSFSLTGESAPDAEIRSAEYQTEDGETGVLDCESGVLTLVPGADGTRRYTFLITAEVDDGGETRSVTFTAELEYRADEDIRLVLTWQYRGITPKTAECAPDGHASLTIKQNQLTRGELLYALDLEGESAGRARLLEAVLEGADVSETLDERGSVTLSIPTGQTESAYVLRARAVLEDTGREISFRFRIAYTGDARMTMEYTLRTDNGPEVRSLTCENGRTASAERIYSDQLEEDVLQISLSAGGEDMTIERITIYQSGDGRERTLAQSPGASWSGEVTLLTDGEREGQNNFTVTARDGSGTESVFTFAVPYIRRGDKTIRIEQNLPEDGVIENETDFDLRIRAQTLESDGSVLTTIRASSLTVTLDGEVLEYTGASGDWQQYRLYAKNPRDGDENTHTLVITARDDYGNEATETYLLTGRRTEEGRVIGEASIYIDMSALGLGTSSRIKYDVLAGEPISYVVAKAVWGYDAGEPYGTAKETFGWDASYCSYKGKLEKGFYLERMGDGSNLGRRANALSGRWRDYGDSPAEILAAIDGIFGAGTPESALWRCIYRNGLVLGDYEDDSIGEFDFTNGSGWLYQLDGEIYPGASMSDYTLQDGSTLVLRYTLAYGWDVGAGMGSDGNIYGYCARAINGRIEVEHHFENGVCVCCGMEEGGCAHEHTEYRDYGDGTCGLYCLDCEEYIGGHSAHVWQYSWEPGSTEHTRTCEHCGLSEQEAHDLIEGVSTADCTEGGTVTVTCPDCGMQEEREVPPLGHVTGNQWQYTAEEHYQLCSRCGKEIDETRGAHDYVYSEPDEDWICTGCGAYHNFELCGEEHLTLVSESETTRTYRCGTCGHLLEQPGDFRQPEPDLPPDPDGGDPPESGGDGEGGGEPPEPESAGD